MREGGGREGRRGKGRGYASERGSEGARVSATRTSLCRLWLRASRPEPSGSIRRWLRSRIGDSLMLALAHCRASHRATMVQG
jgi:hypothetical protein